MKARILKSLSTALVAAMPLLASADVLELRFTGSIPVTTEGGFNSIDQTNYFGFGIDAGSGLFTLDGKSVEGALLLDLARAPVGFSEGSPFAWTYRNDDPSDTTNGRGVPGGSWIESWFRVDGVLAPDLVDGSGNQFNGDEVTLVDGTTADGWMGIDWAAQVDEPTPGRAVSFEDALYVSIFNAPDLLNGLALGQEFTLNAGDFDGVGQFRFIHGDSAVAGSNVLATFGDFNLQTVSVRLVTTNPPIPEPGTAALMVAGLAAVGFMVRRRKA